jgi:hypothetical protein
MHAPRNCEILSRAQRRYSQDREYPNCCSENSDVISRKAVLLALIAAQDGCTLRNLQADGPAASMRM